MLSGRPQGIEMQDRTPVQEGLFQQLEDKRSEYGQMSFRRRFGGHVSQILLPIGGPVCY